MAQHDIQISTKSYLHLLQSESARPGIRLPLLTLLPNGVRSKLSTFPSDPRVQQLTTPSPDAEPVPRRWRTTPRSASASTSARPGPECWRRRRRRFRSPAERPNPRCSRWVFRQRLWTPQADPSTTFTHDLHIFVVVVFVRALCPPPPLLLSGAQVLLEHVQTDDVSRVGEGGGVCVQRLPAANP